MVILFKINKMNNGNEDLIQVDFTNKTYKTGYNCDLLKYKIILKTKDMEYLLNQIKQNNFKKIN